MSKKLQILVPQYNEEDWVIKPLLDSIKNQCGIDFNDIGVIICNDGSDKKLSNSFLQNYPFEIKYFKEPHRGVSGTRNACMDYADAEAIIFADCDDCFSTNCYLAIAIQELNNPFDFLNAPFFEEHPINDLSSFYIVRQANPTFIHGKVYNLKFLKDNNIRWKEELTLNEDSYFNALVNAVSKSTRVMTFPGYVWKHNPNSVTRQDSLFELKYYTNFILSGDCLVSELLKRGYTQVATDSVSNQIIQAYWFLQEKRWDDKVELKEEVYKFLKEYYKKYRSIWESIPEDKIKENIDKTKTDFFSTIEFPDNIENINEWLNKIN